MAFLAGALSALAFAPFNIFPILLLTVPVLVWLIDGSTVPEGTGLIRRLLPAAVAGWAFGFGFFVAGLWWIGAAFLVDADQFAWLMPFAVIALPAGLALFWGLAARCARAWSGRRAGRASWSSLALSPVAEWLRGHLFTGFPWNAFGYALTPAPIMMQSAAIVGLWGLTLAALIIFAAPAVLADVARRTDRGRAIFLVATAALLLAHVAYGALRLSVASEGFVPDVHLRIVQPSINQNEKWVEANADAIFKRYLELSDSASSPARSGVGSATILVWPESALPFFLSERPDALAATRRAPAAGNDAPHRCRAL